MTLKVATGQWITEKSASENINSIRILLARTVQHRNTKNRREWHAEITNSTRLILLWLHKVIEINKVSYTVAYNLEAFT